MLQKETLKALKIDGSMRGVYVQDKPIHDETYPTYSVHEARDSDGNGVVHVDSEGKVIVYIGPEGPVYIFDKSEDVAGYVALWLRGNDQPINFDVQTKKFLTEEEFLLLTEAMNMAMY